MSLVLDNVRKDVGAETHIRDVSLALENGILNILLGPTQAGKTSLMRLMAGLDRPTGGRVIVGGIDLTTLNEEGRARFRRENVGAILAGTRDGWLGRRGARVRPDEAN